MHISSIQSYNKSNSNYLKSNNKKQSFGYKLPSQAEPIVINIRNSFKNDVHKRQKWEKALNGFINKKFDAEKLVANRNLLKDACDFIDELDIPKTEIYSEKKEIVPEKSVFKRCLNYFCGKEPKTRIVREHISNSYDYKNIAVELDYTDKRAYFLPYAETPQEDYHLLIARSGKVEIPIKTWAIDNMAKDFDKNYLKKHLSTPEGIEKLENMVDENIKKWFLLETDSRYSDYIDDFLVVSDPIEDLK